MDAADFPLEGDAPHRRLLNAAWEMKGEMDAGRVSHGDMVHLIATLVVAFNVQYDELAEATVKLALDALLRAVKAEGRPKEGA
jgi:hypothetical protein